MTPGAYAQRTAPPQHAGERCRYLGADETGSLARIMHEDGTIGYVGADEIREVLKPVQEPAFAYCVIASTNQFGYSVFVFKTAEASRDAALDWAVAWGCPDEDVDAAETVEADGLVLSWKDQYGEDVSVRISKVTEAR